MPGAQFPMSSDTMKALGYVYDNEGWCRGCEASIEWWITPKGKPIPISVIRTATILKASGDVRQPHFMDCPNAGDFRKKS